jgi:hypothetical protein
MGIGLAEVETVKTATAEIRTAEIGAVEIEAVQASQAEIAMEKRQIREAGMTAIHLHAKVKGRVGQASN